MAARSTRVLLSEWDSESPSAVNDLCFSAVASKSPRSALDASVQLRQTHVEDGRAFRVAVRTLKAGKIDDVTIAREYERWALELERRQPGSALLNDIYGKMISGDAVPEVLQDNARLRRARLHIDKGASELAQEDLKRLAGDDPTALSLLTEAAPRAAARLCDDLSRKKEKLLQTKACLLEAGSYVSDVEDKLVDLYTTLPVVWAEDIRELYRRHPGMRKRLPVEQCYVSPGSIRDMAAGASRHLEPAPGRGTAAIYNKLAEAEDSASIKQCLQFYGVHACLRDIRTCSDVGSLARYAKTLDRDQLHVFSMSIYRKKAALYRELWDGDRAAAEALFRLHRMLAALYACGGDGPSAWEKKDYQLQQARLNFRVLHPDDDFPSLPPREQLCH